MKNKIETSNPNATGCSCFFFKLTDKVGFKMYFTRTEALASLSKQKIAYRFNIGPKAGKRLFNLTFRGRKAYGFFTEVVEIWSDYFKGADYDQSVQISKWKKEFIDDVREEISEDLDLLDLHDLHLDNLGFVKNRPVIIDFTAYYDYKQEITRDEYFDLCRECGRL